MKNEKVLTLVEGAVMVALATVLSFVKIVHLPWGGSITLLSMLPIIVFSIKRGVANGLAASFVFALIQFIQGCADGLFGWGLTPVALVACIFIDYIFAFTVLGLAGIFRKYGMPLKRISMSRMESTATPALPTSPTTRGWSES